MRLLEMVSILLYLTLLTVQENQTVISTVAESTTTESTTANNGNTLVVGQTSSPCGHSNLTAMSNTSASNDCKPIDVTGEVGQTVSPCEESNTTDKNISWSNDCKSRVVPGPVKGNSQVDYVGVVVVPIFLIMGLCGNSLTIAVMRSQHFRKMTSSLILIALSLSDTSLILMLPFNKMFFRKLVGTDVRAISEAGCKAFFCLWRSSKMTSSWFIVFVCFERFVAVWFPLKTKLICTRRNALIGIACVYIGIFSLNGAWTFSSKVVKGACVPNAIIPGTEAVAGAFLVGGTVVYSLIPTIILLILTPAICLKLFQHSRARRSLSNNQDDKTDEAAKTTAMLLGVTFAFIVLVSPISLAHIIAFYQGDNIFESQAPGMPEFREVSQVMEQLNYSINFFLYVLCSKSFRLKVAQFLGFQMCLDQGGKKKGRDDSSFSVKTRDTQMA